MDLRQLDAWPTILWLVPIVYALHIVEEAPRFVHWTKRYT